MTSVPSNVPLDRIHAYWLASNYLCAGMLYLRDNALLRRPLKADHIKRRILGHWGTCPGLSFTLAHLNRLIVEHDLNLMYVCGPGHGAAAVLAHAYLDGHYSERYPECSQDEAGMLRLFQKFSAPGGVGSHCSAHTPGSIHEGGELGYSLSHAFGAAFDNPDLIVAAMIGDGEAETGALAASWHSSKFLNPARDGAVLPILHLNGYKIANPAILARIPHAELLALFEGYGYRPTFVGGADPPAMHRKMARALDQCLADIQEIQAQARAGGHPSRPRWPMIVLRTPKGWTGPQRVHGHAIEDSWRAHQIPVSDPAGHADELHVLGEWLNSYRPGELFDATGRLIPELRALAPKGNRRISANPHANGGDLRRALDLPDIAGHQIAVPEPGVETAQATQVLGEYLREVMRMNLDQFRVFGPDETASNRLSAIYDASGKTWMAQMLDSDADGGNLSPTGRVMEILSEQTLEGWLEGYVLTGRHGLFSTYEAFAHVIDSMFNQHAKWLAKAKQLDWRTPVPSLNLLITSLVWRQDHNGFSHQDPGFLDVVANKSPDVVRIYLPPDTNCLLSVTDHCLRSVDYVNVIVADKQPHLAYLNGPDAMRHCQAGIGVWEWASTFVPHDPDVVIACAGDIPTQEALAAVLMLKRMFSGLKIRFINVVDLFTLMSNHHHPHGLSDEAFDRLFTLDKPVIFNFHAYPSLIHKLCYHRRNHANFHVHGYREQGDVNTPFELAILNGIDRYSLAMDVFKRVPRLRTCSAAHMQTLLTQQTQALSHARAEGIDPEDIRNWQWSAAGVPRH